MSMMQRPTLTRTPVEVHWVRADADGGAADLAFLSGEERAAWARMLPDVRRQRVVARGALRRLLGARLGLSPAEVRFTRGPFGKPGLSQKHRSRLAFSVSHAASWSVIAMAEVAALGVDIERIDPAIEFELLAPRIMSQGELRHFLSRPQPLRCRLFYRAWVMKEAVVKASGHGLSRELADIEVLSGDPVPGRAGPRLLHSAGHCWSVADLPGPPGLAGAVVVAGSEPKENDGVVACTRSGRSPIHFDLGIHHAGGRELGHPLQAATTHFLS